MLIRLSLRNVRRQLGEFALFYVTLACTAASMYAFNFLIYSDTVKSLPDMEILPYLIITASAFVILIIGWLVGYMVNYMLKKRSREFSIYMISGITNRRISTLIFRENCLIGMLSFIPGILFGMLFSQILEAVLLHLLGLSYTLHFGFSMPALRLTFFYFLAMLLYSIRKNRKWIRRIQLRDLLYYDRQNETSPISGSATAVMIFLLSVFAGCTGLVLIYIQPLGKGYDVLFGTVLLALFLFGFFLSVPAFLVARFGNRTDWKYRKHRLVTFRVFTAKIHSMSTLMGILSILFMLSITFGGIGTTIGLMMAENVKADAFDIMILHKGESHDFSQYETVIRQKFSARDHVYEIYTNGKTDFRSVHDQTIAEAGRSPFTYAEFLYDTCMSHSDYIRLRRLLGYRDLNLNPSLCYVHCVPALEKNFKALIGQQNHLNCAGYTFAEAENCIFTEPFNQVNNYYGNGSGYVIIVPDDAVREMKIVYSVYAAVTEAPLSPDELQDITDSCSSLIRLAHTSAKSTSSGAPTVFIKDDADYLSGKWAEKAEFHYLYSILICLFYLAVIFEITGAAILATQILGDRQKKQKQDCILYQLGMNRQMVYKLNNRHLLCLFLLPLIPSLMLASCFIFICAKKILSGFFMLPNIPAPLSIGQSFGISLALFSLLYGIYYAAARISYGR